MYVLSAQWCESQDMGRYMAPTIVITSLASFLGFFSSSALIDNDPLRRMYTGLAGGLCGILASLLTTLRNVQKVGAHILILMLSGSVCSL